MEILKKPVYFLNDVEFWPTFEIQICITLAIFWKNVAKVHFLESPQKSLTAYEMTALSKNEKILCFLGGYFFKIIIADILNF